MVRVTDKVGFWLLNLSLTASNRVSMTFPIAIRTIVMGLSKSLHACYLETEMHFLRYIMLYLEQLVKCALQLQHAPVSVGDMLLPPPHDSK